MFKSFYGFQMVETYHEWKKNHRTKDKTVSRSIKLAIATIIPLILWLLPTSAFGIDGLTVIEQRTIAIFIFAILMWVFEAVPAWTTSMVVVVLLLFTSSNSSLWFFRDGYDPETLGTAINYK